MRLKMSARPLRALACAAMLALAAPVAFAAPPSDAQVDELMEVMRVEQSLDGMWPQIEAMQQQAAAQAAAGKQLSAGQQAEIQATLGRMMAGMRAAMAWEKVQPVYREIYAKSFDDADVAALVAFYRSEAGQNLLDKMPQLMQNTMVATQQLMAPAMQQMQQEIETQAAKAAAEGEAEASDADSAK
ncbi:DUF2059 domain-containing protein [Lysobacter sp. A3-1-A15]|uniref:DUF2059 domain-containing protein n=1 Tax=Novilysobacter viscosus TaxID=3098602 RepID=UPI00398358DF